MYEIPAGYIRRVFFCPGPAPRRGKGRLPLRGKSDCPIGVKALPYPGKGDCPTGVKHYPTKVKRMPHRGKTDYPAKAIAQPLPARNAPHKKGEAGSIDGPGFAALISEAVMCPSRKPDRPCRLGSIRQNRLTSPVESGAVSRFSLCGRFGRFGQFSLRDRPRESGVQRLPSRCRPRRRQHLRH